MAVTRINEIEQKSCLDEWNPIESWDVGMNQTGQSWKRKTGNGKRETGKGKREKGKRGAKTANQRKMESGKIEAGTRGWWNL